MSTAEQPNLQVNDVELSAMKDSTISKVSVYYERAEVTRQAQFALKAGQNRITILDLPLSLLPDTVSVQDQDGALISFVRIVSIPGQLLCQSTPQELEALHKKQREVENAIERVKKSQDFLNDYMSNVTNSQSSITEIEVALRGYNMQYEKLDVQVVALEDELEELERQISQGSKTHEAAATLRAAFDVFSEQEKQMKISLMYGVCGVDWNASYVCQIRSLDESGTLSIVYQAAIRQATGESWDNVSLTFETAIPRMLATAPPESMPWYIGTKAPEDRDMNRARSRSPRSSSASRTHHGSRRRSRSRSLEFLSKSTSALPPTRQEDSPDLLGPYSVISPQQSKLSLSQPQEIRNKYYPASATTIFPEQDNRAPTVIVPEADDDFVPTIILPPHARSPTIKPKSDKDLSPVPTITFHPLQEHPWDAQDILASLYVPELVSIPADGEVHQVTLTKLEFDATLLRYAIPRVDNKVYLKVQAKNNSEYPFLRGLVKVHLDGRFVTHTQMEAVKPSGTFNLTLGVDPSIRLAYPPVEKMLKKSRMLQSRSTMTCIQRITLTNLKSTTVENLRLTDHLPVSGEKDIEVKVQNPALGNPILPTTVAKSASRRVQVSSKIAAFWEGADDPEIDCENIGKDGKITWHISALQPHEKISISFQYEIGGPENLPIYGI